MNPIDSAPTPNAPALPNADGMARRHGLLVGHPVDPFEELLMSPQDVRRQHDPATGCGPACLEMVLDLEQADTSDRAPGSEQRERAALCQDAPRPELWPHPFRWAASPASLQHAINSQVPDVRAPSSRRQHYHIVHAASAVSPLAEIMSWLRGHQTAARKLCLPSFLLTYHGAHWMLAVGARVKNDDLGWLAAADPDTGQLIGCTPHGLREIFTPNAIGKHPDWTSRFVAVIPSVLPRRRPIGTPTGTGSSEDTLPTGTPPDHINTPPALAVRLSPKVFPMDQTHAAPPPPADHARLMETLTGFARDARHPLAQAWLAPLLQARHIVANDSAGTPTNPTTPGSARWAWVLDDSRRVVAKILLRGTPAILLRFAVVTASGEP